MLAEDLTFARGDVTNMRWGGVSQLLISSCAGFLQSGALVSEGLAEEERNAHQRGAFSVTDECGRTNDSDQRSDDLVGQMLSQGRYALLLRPQIVRSLTVEQRDLAVSTFTEATSCVPEGEVFVESWRSDDVGTDWDYPASGCRLPVELMYLDRFAITNQQYRVFVKCEGYLQESLWHPNVWPRVSELTDQTGHAGPRFWSEGSYPAGLEYHPVVGVSWFEAGAYARWAGKRLPCDAEWVKAASWPVIAAECEPIQRKYPWGETMDLARSNLWASHLGTTVPVTDFPEGASVGGVSQLLGNVWEWTTDNLAIIAEDCGLEFDQPLKSLRGGAFDTYFESQVNTQFQSGDSPLARQHNLGFRCAISGCDVSAGVLPKAPSSHSRGVQDPIVEVTSS